MTEAEWRSCNDSELLVRHIEKPYPERRARLLMLAFCRLRAHAFVHAIGPEALQALDDHYAAPFAPERPIEGPEARALYDRVNQYLHGGDGGVRDYYAVSGVLHGIEPASVAVENGTEPYDMRICLVNTSFRGRGRQIGTRSTQARFVRDVFGNPFRPVTFSPSWRTDTAVAIAAQMYASRDFSAMPVLADALQDAGCDSTEVLRHCRGRGPHVRGCWVVDRVLGKG